MSEIFDQWPDYGSRILARLKARRGADWPLKDGVDELDGRVFAWEFLFVCGFSDHPRYLGESMWNAVGVALPNGYPLWVASGDLELIKRLPEALPRHGG